MNPAACGRKLMKSGKKQEERLKWPLQKVLTALEKHEVQYLLIGGQAVVAYGASQFTRDADFWVNPTKKNIQSLRKALKELDATRRFLPPLQLRYLKKGHGVHFRISHEGNTFLIDILGKPPRVKSFSAAAKETSLVKWHSLDVPVLDIRRLVETKKTNRDRDYLVIQRLTDEVYRSVKRSVRLRKNALRWLLGNLRTPKYIKDVVRHWEKAAEISRKSGRHAVVLALNNAGDMEIQKALDHEKECLKRKNIEYWKPFIAELRKLKRRVP
jgi:hypothetical protein